MPGDPPVGPRVLALPPKVVRALLHALGEHREPGVVLLLDSEPQATIAHHASSSSAACALLSRFTPPGLIVLLQERQKSRRTGLPGARDPRLLLAVEGDRLALNYGHTAESSATESPRLVHRQLLGIGRLPACRRLLQGLGISMGAPQRFPSLPLPHLVAHLHLYPGHGLISLAS